MKSFRCHITSLMLALILVLSLTACEDDSQAQTKYATQPDPQPPTVLIVPEINKEVKDSLDKYTARIDSISKEVKEALDNVVSIRKDVSNLKDNEMWWWIAMGISIIALVIAVFVIKLCVDLQSRANRQRRDIEEIVRERREAVYNSKHVTKSALPTDYDSLKRRVHDLELKLNQHTSYAHPVQPHIEPVTKQIVRDTTKKGYFGTPVPAADPYFKKLLISQDSDARFVAEIIGNKAIFKPLESNSHFGTFVSNDAMRGAVDFKNCAPTELSSMQVITPGEAEQRDNKWVITKKAIVHLS